MSFYQLLDQFTVGILLPSEFPSELKMVFLRRSNWLSGLVDALMIDCAWELLPIATLCICVYIFTCLRSGALLKHISLCIFIEFCRSEIECLWTQYIYCVLPVRDRPSFRPRLCLTQEAQCYPNFNLAISLYWGVLWWPEVSRKESLEANEFFWDHSFFLH